jgi:hypothetical protein
VPRYLAVQSLQRQKTRIAYLQNGECKLVSRNQRNLGFEALKRSLAKLPAQNGIIDGSALKEPTLRSEQIAQHSSTFPSKRDETSKSPEFEIEIRPLSKR